MRTRVSWQEKMDRPAKVCAIPARLEARFGRGKMLIPSPLDVDAAIRAVPKGKLITSAQLRDRLAKSAGVSCACPMTTGMFVRIAAEAAEENARAGKSRITPYWRVVRDDGSLMENLPGGPWSQAEHLEAEGHAVDRTGKLRVTKLERALVR